MLSLGQSLPSSEGFFLPFSASLWPVPSLCAHEHVVEWAREPILASDNLFITKRHVCGTTALENTGVTQEWTVYLPEFISLSDCFSEAEQAQALLLPTLVMPDFSALLHVSVCLSVLNMNDLAR